MRTAVDSIGDFCLWHILSKPCEADEGEKDSSEDAYHFVNVKIPAFDVGVPLDA